MISTMPYSGHVQGLGTLISQYMSIDAQSAWCDLHQVLMSQYCRRAALSANTSLENFLGNRNSKYPACTS